MKAFRFTFIDGLKKGLRKFRKDLGLVECHNAMPCEDGLSPHEVITSMNASGISWGGEGKLSAYSRLRDVTIEITDYISGVDLETVSVWVDGVLKGTTDASGELLVEDLALGGHTLKLTKTGYTDSDADTLLNDYFVVT